MFVIKPGRWVHMATDLWIYRRVLLRGYIFTPFCHRYRRWPARCANCPRIQ